MKKRNVLVWAIFAAVVLFIGCKKTVAPTMPAPPDAMMTVTEIVRVSDSLRATQTFAAVSTSTALAVLFTQTVTMTVTCTNTPTLTRTVTLVSTATRTRTATFTRTVTCTFTVTGTATATPLVYAVYDGFTSGAILDPLKWDVQSSGPESVMSASSGLLVLKARTTVPGSEVTVNVTSKYPSGTKAFKGLMVLHQFYGYSINDWGTFTIEIGNEQDGFTQRFYEVASGSVFQGGVITFEVKHLSGFDYTCSINGASAQNLYFQQQPQVKLKLMAHLTSNFIGSTAETLFWANSFYYY